MSNRDRQELRVRHACESLRFGRDTLRNTRVATLAVLIHALFATGCGQDFVAAEAVSECSEVATQCRLSDGPLGVCERRTCGADESPPCFVCTPQH